ncbi:MAG: hypothetical protein KAS23_11655 [Anaerohalosphaera sp.]|nr:hypothetical protein [Anaerohalosphaera sp.]
MAQLLISLAFFAGFESSGKIPFESFELAFNYAPAYADAPETSPAQQRTEMSSYDAHQAEFQRQRLRDERIATRRNKYGKKASYYSAKTYAPRNYSISKVDLSKQIDMRVFQPDMTLDQALTEIQNAGLPLVIIWSDLERNAFIDENTPIGLQARGVTTITHALKLILLSVDQGGSKVGFVNDNGVVTVATRNLEIAHRQLKVYNVSELTNPGWWFPQNNNNSFGNSQFGNSQFGQGQIGTARN